MGDNQEGGAHSVQLQQQPLTCVEGHDNIKLFTCISVKDVFCFPPSKVNISIGVSAVNELRNCCFFCVFFFGPNIKGE